jgi:hypothetical protein
MTERDDDPMKALLDARAAQQPSQMQQTSSGGGKMIVVVAMVFLVLLAVFAITRMRAKQQAHRDAQEVDLKYSDPWPRQRGGYPPPPPPPPPPPNGRSRP